MVLLSKDSDMIWGNGFQDDTAECLQHLLLKSAPDTMIYNGVQILKIH